MSEDYKTKFEELEKRMKALEDASLPGDKKGEAPKAIDPNAQPAVQNPEKTMQDGNKPHVDVVVGNGAKHTDPEDDEDDKEDGVEKMKAYAEQAAEAAVKKFAASIGVKLPSAGAPVVSEPAKEKTFAELVDEKTKELGDKTKATLFCIQNHKKEYAASRLVAPRKR